MRPCQIWDELRQRRCIYWGCRYIWRVENIFHRFIATLGWPLLLTESRRYEKSDGLRVWALGQWLLRQRLMRRGMGFGGGSNPSRGIGGTAGAIERFRGEEWIENLCGTCEVRFWAPSLGDSLGQKIRRGRGGGGAIAINMTIDFVCGAGPNAI